MPETNRQLIEEALTEPTLGPASDRDAAMYWANLARKLADRLHASDKELGVRKSQVDVLLITQDRLIKHHPAFGTVGGGGPVVTNALTPDDLARIEELAENARLRLGQAIIRWEDFGGNIGAIIWRDFGEPLVAGVRSRDERIAELEAAIAEAPRDTTPCAEEKHSWDYFRPEQMDSYWMRCDKLGPHDKHENSETGAHWTTALTDRAGADQ